MKKIITTLFILFYSIFGSAQLNLNITDTTVCNNLPFQACANIPPSSLSGLNFDDRFSSVINIGFQFNYFGTNYNQCLISENNFITFSLNFAGLHSSNYMYPTSLNANELNKAILFPYQDLDVSYGGVIRYMTVGQAPNRKFIVEFCDVAYYSTPCHNINSRNQLILYETSNVIEMHVGVVSYCTNWPSTGSNGHAVEGILNGPNTFFVPNRGPGSTPWLVSATSPSAHRFTPNSTTNYSITTIPYYPSPFILTNQGSYTWYAGNSTIPFASNACATLVPDTVVDYFVVKYTGPLGCGATTNSTIFDTVNVNYTVPFISKPLSYCASQLPTTWNGFTIPANAVSNPNYDTVFVSNTPNCDTNFILNLIILPGATPSFAPVGPVCQGTIISQLPTTSLNGITGTWSPALNNTATTTYTFTPNAGQCASQTTLQIIVSPSVIATFNPVAAICSGDSLNPLPTTSLNGITGSWNPALNNLATTTYTFTPNNPGQCATSDTFTIVVNPILTPTFTPVSAICQGAALMALPSTSTNGISGNWSPVVNNTITTTYTFTPNVGQCAAQTTMVVNVNPMLLPVFTPVSSACQGSILPALPTTSINGILGSWSPTLNNTTTTTYTFTPSAGQCASQATLQIVINPNTNPTFSPVAAICAGSVLNPLPTTSLNGITGSWSPTLNNLVTTPYTFTPNAGQNCPSSTTMQIVVSPYLIGTRFVSFCDGGSYLFNGISYISSVTGVKDTLPNINSCDSIITLNLIVHPKTFGIQQATICDGSSYTFNGLSHYINNNTAKDTLTNQWGCDSIVTLNLTVLPVNPTTTAVSLMGCGSVIYSNTNYFLDTNFVDTITTTFGCDSLYKNVSIAVYPQFQYTEIIDMVGCESVKYEDSIYSNSHNFVQQFKTINGCDSLARTINIQVLHFELSASFSPDRPYAGEQITINTSANTNNYDIISWQPSTLFSNQNTKIQNFSMTTPEPITIIGESGGCFDTVLVNVGDLPTYSTDVKMPNAFSPNGDGRNDVFRPVFKIDRAYSVVEFWVYNRYGQIIYSSGNSNAGWDGYFKGKLQDQGVYFYSVTIRFLDNVEKTFNGDVTLIR